MEVDFNETERMVDRCAKAVACVVFNDVAHYDELWSKVEDECFAFAHGYVTNGLQILASYGWSDALDGGVDREDSPLYLFEDDVMERVKQLLENEGIEIVD